MWRAEWLAPFFGKVVLMIEHPHVHVAFGFVGEILEDVTPANDFDDGHVNLVVPVRHGFLLGDVALKVEPHEIVMHGDVFQHAVEAVGDGEFDIGFGTDVIQPGAFEEVDLCAEDFKVFGFDVWCDVDAGGAFADFGFDEFLSLLAGDGDAVMSVHHEIDLAHFVEHDGREMDVFVEGAVHLLPAAGELVSFRKEGAVEFVIAVEAARDLVHADGFHAAIDGAADAKFFLHIIVGKEFGGLARKHGQHLVEKGFESRPAKVGAHA